MEKFNLQEKVDEILNQLRQYGASPKKLKIYRFTGFGNMIRYYKRKKITEISLNMLDAYLNEMYLAYTNKEFSTWKWQSLRRSCELLKNFVATNTVEMKPLRPWDYSQGKATQSVVLDTPTDEQINDPSNLFALIWKVRQFLLEYGFTENSIRHYTSEGLTVILRSHYEAGTEIYSREITDALVSAKRKQYEEGCTSRQAYQNLRKAAYLIEEMHETGNIILKKIPDWNMRIPRDEFAKFLTDFCGCLKKEHRIHENTIPTLCSAVRRFLFGLEDYKIYSAQQLTPIMVNRCVTKLAAYYPGGAGNLLYAVRMFLRYLFNTGVTASDLSCALPKTAAAKKTFHEPFTGDEVKSLLAAPDQSTAIGKRDYAIMLLAIQTGLRACDIVRMKRESINWREGRISIIQHKTGIPLSLPLPVEAGNAIAEYLIYHRPDCKLPYVFICHTGQPRPLKNRSASGMVSKYMSCIGLYDPKKLRSFHSLRRTFGTNLLKSEIPMELIQQLLGHSQMNSMKPYLSVEEEGLKRCALPLFSSDQEVIQE